MYGQFKGEVCNRNGCKGILVEHHTDTCCSCHINPPCSHCTDDRNYCPECGWQGSDEQTTYVNGYRIKYDPETSVYKSWRRRDLDNTKIDYHVFSHTSSTQICEGVYPEGTTTEQILKKVKGTFGGRFEYCRHGKFKYIAYTD